MSKFQHCCIEMDSAVNNPVIPIRFLPKFREYGVDVQDGGSSYLMIRFCPWCGVTLPSSLRDEWFDALEASGLDPHDPESIPQEFRDESWYAQGPPKLT